MIKIADLYIRVSTKEQKLTGFSQGYQEDVLKTYCIINSLEIGKKSSRIILQKLLIDQPGTYYLLNKKIESFQLPGFYWLPNGIASVETQVMPII